MIGARGKKGAATSVRLSPKRLKGLPGQAASLLRAATGFLDAGDTERAGSSASLALALAPDHAECLRVVAAVQSRREGGILGLRIDRPPANAIVTGAGERFFAAVWRGE